MIKLCCKVSPHRNTVPDFPPRCQSEAQHVQHSQHRSRSYPNPHHQRHADKHLDGSNHISKKYRVRQHHLRKNWPVEANSGALNAAAQIFLESAVRESRPEQLILTEKNKEDRRGHAYYRNRPGHSSSVSHQGLTLPPLLNTFPFFITNRTFSRTLTSRSGSPSTATISASAPGVIAPICPRISSISAGREVALLMASIGDMPRRTIWENSRAIDSLHGMPPMSVPKTIFTPACSALGNDTSCTAARLRSRCPAAVSAGAQSV